MAQLNGDLYAIIKGFIDARDSQSRAVYGVFVVVVSARATHFIAQAFFSESIDKEMQWNDLMDLLSSDAASPSDPDLARYCKELNDHIRIHRPFEIGRGDLDEKALERKVSSFCGGTLGLNAVTFIEASKVEEDELLSLIPHIFDKPVEDEKPQEAYDFTENAEEDIDTKDADPAGGKKPDEMYLSCSPVLDAVAGVAAGGLVNGDRIDVALPDGSMYGKIMSNIDPHFNGIVSAEVLGVKLDEYGAAVVALKIAEGVSGVLRISESVKLRRSARTSSGVRASSRSQDAIIAVFGIALLLAVIAALFYIFSSDG